MALLSWCFATPDVDSAGDGNAVIDVNVEVDMRAVDQSVPSPRSVRALVMFVTRYGMIQGSHFNIILNLQ